MKTLLVREANSHIQYRLELKQVEKSILVVTTVLMASMVSLGSREMDWSKRGVVLRDGGKTWSMHKWKNTREM